MQVDDLLFGGQLFLADPVLSKAQDAGGKVFVTRLLDFDSFVMTPCTSYLGFDPELAEMVVAGLKKEAGVPMAQFYASGEAKTELAADLVEMALCSVDSVREELEERFTVREDAPVSQ